MRLRNCHNFHDFRLLAKRRLPSPIFDYIDGAADDEVTHRRNTASFERCDLVPNVLRGVEIVDILVIVLGQKLAVPFYCSPTALQRLFHHQGERAVAAAAAKYGTMFGVSSLGTVSLEELRKTHDTPQIYQFYFHKDRGLNRAMLQRAKEAGVEVMMLTVDSITGGNRERESDIHTAGISLDRLIKKIADLCESLDLGEQRVGFAARKPEQRCVHVDVFDAGEFRIKTRA